MVGPCFQESRIQFFWRTIKLIILIIFSMISVRSSCNVYISYLVLFKKLRIFFPLKHKRRFVGPKRYAAPPFQYYSCWKLYWKMLFSKVNKGQGSEFVPLSKCQYDKMYRKMSIITLRWTKISR